MAAKFVVVLVLLLLAAVAAAAAAAEAATPAILMANGSFVFELPSSPASVAVRMTTGSETTTTPLATVASSKFPPEARTHQPPHDRRLIDRCPCCCVHVRQIGP
jgi:hypothetical protein